MPIEIKDLDGGLGNVIRAWGVVLEDDYIDLHRKHLSQDKDKFKKYLYGLNDYTAATKAKIETASITYVVQLCEIAAKANSHAIVATVASNDLYFGLARMAEALMHKTGWETMVFRSTHEAKAWIKTRVKEKHGIDTLTFE